MLIRAEKKDDQDDVFAVNGSAFETPAEATLVNVLREQAQPVVSLVAEDNGNIVGHILFSPVDSKISPSELAKWILEDHLNVRLHLQLHKIIWPDVNRGV